MKLGFEDSDHCGIADKLINKYKINMLTKLTVLNGELRNLIANSVENDLVKQRAS